MLVYDPRWLAGEYCTDINCWFLNISLLFSFNFFCFVVFSFFCSLVSVLIYGFFVIIRLLFRFYLRLSRSVSALAGWGMVYFFEPLLLLMMSFFPIVPETCQYVFECVQFCESAMCVCVRLCAWQRKYFLEFNSFVRQNNYTQCIWYHWASFVSHYVLNS